MAPSTLKWSALLASGIAIGSLASMLYTSTDLKPADPVDKHILQHLQRPGIHKDVKEIPKRLSTPHLLGQHWTAVLKLTCDGKKVMYAYGHSRDEALCNLEAKLVRSMEKDYMVGLQYRWRALASLQNESARRTCSLMIP